MPFQQYPFKGGIPSGNTAGRPGSPVIGDTYYNGQLEILEIYNGTAWVAVSAPAATPQIVSVTDGSSTSAYASTAGVLTVVFQPGVGGSTPTQYNAFTTAGGFSGFSSTSTVTLTGLTPGTEYVVYGNAQNNFGTTTNTPNFAGRTPTTLPQAPTIGTLSDVTTGGALNLTFTAGSSGGKTITNYKYSFDGTTYTAFSPAQTTSPLSLTGLTNGTSYNVRLKAVTANGDSPASNASNSVAPTKQFSVSYLVIAGGGAGGQGVGGAGVGGGGGAGGYRTNLSGQTSGRGSSAEASKTITAGTNYTVTVGAGGSGSGSINTAPTNGNDSVFDNITSTRGGYGGRGSADTTRAPQSGGSGGGAGQNFGNGASGTTAQGYDGGSNGGTNSGGGGGGAGANGSNGGTSGCQGGNGLSNNITGTSVTRAGGGAGAKHSAEGTTSASGGSGGGGTGGVNTSGGNNGGNGTANTGSGGGGGAEFTASTGGNGGSGVVILRWLTSAATISVGAGLTADATGTDGSHSYKVFTAGTGTVSFS